MKIDPFVERIKQRITENGNAIIVVNGPTGSGKSYASLRLALRISKKLGTDFTIQNNMDFKFRNLLQKMDYNAKPGMVYLFEEVGAVGSGGSSAEWQSKTNKFMNTFLQTGRYLNQVLIMTTPTFFNIQAKDRQLAHFQCVMAGINRANHISYMRVKEIQVNTTTGKLYFKYIRLKNNVGTMKLKTYPLKLPPPEVIEPYETLKRKYGEELKEEILIGSDTRKVLTDKQQIIHFFLEQGKTVPEIAKELGCNKTNVYKHMERLKIKGYLLRKPIHTPIKASS